MIKSTTSSDRPALPVVPAGVASKSPAPKPARQAGVQALIPPIVPQPVAHGGELLDRAVEGEPLDPECGSRLGVVALGVANGFEDVPPLHFDQ